MTILCLHILASIPVLGHADGLCSIFIDESADVDKTVNVVLDAKV
mgnify:CR=1 FL=1